MSDYVCERCFKSWCECFYASDEDKPRERLIEDVCRLTRERDEALAEARKHGNYAQNAVDIIVHYRNLAIVLGAKPEQMIGEGDRKLCADGIDKDDDGDGYHMSVQDCLDDTATAWGLYDKLRKERDALGVALLGVLWMAEKWADSEHRTHPCWEAIEAARSLVTNQD